MENELDRSNRDKRPVQTRDAAKKIGDVFLVAVFCTISLSFLLLNYSSLRKSILEQGKGTGTLQQRLMLAEAQFRESIRYRRSFIDLYGVALNILDLKVVGDLDFVKDERGVMQRPTTGVDEALFSHDMYELERVTAAAGTPLVYVSLPDKTRYFGLAKSDAFLFDGQVSSRMGTLLEDEIDCLDIGALIDSGGDAPSFDEFFFKTDVHCSTYGEFWMAKMLAEHLTSRNGIVFPDGERVFDLANHDIARYEFVGNTARSAGKYFAGTDLFEIYKPKFETDLKLVNPSASEQIAGNFEKVMLNGYESREDIDEYTYWVTDYGRFTSPYYKYVNESAPGSAPRILVVGDSIFMRGVAYLTLACKEVTVMDPRYFDGVEYLVGELASEHYDAVVVIATSVNFYRSRFASSTELPDLPEWPAQTSDGWIGTNGMFLDTYNSERIRNADPIPIDREAMRFRLVGWAADFDGQRPLSALYLQVGDMIVRCNYGIERTSVSDHFQNDDLKDTGFDVEFPASYLQGVDELRFIQIGTDGSYRYEPVVYRLPQG